MTKTSAASRRHAYLSRLDKRLDEALEESFPASDSPAVTPEDPDHREGTEEDASELAK